MNVNNHLIIFIKNPELGHVKTRLAASVGDEKALAVYQRLLKITRDQTQLAPCIRHLCYSNHVDENDDWDREYFHKHVQSDGDLGARMLGALQGAFNREAKKVVIIGSDCPEITTEIISDAFASLDKYDVVVGPAKDGGYYLIGMTCPLPMLFKNKKWSTDSVFSDTVLDLTKMGLTHYRLKELSDLDTVSDLSLLQ